ncbi:hypothetical protein MMPV_005082 [Pyropia vietnamensis]
MQRSTATARGGGGGPTMPPARPSRLPRPTVAAAAAAAAAVATVTAVAAVTTAVAAAVSTVTVPAAAGSPSGGTISFGALHNCTANTPGPPDCRRAFAVTLAPRGNDVKALTVSLTDAAGGHTRSPSRLSGGHGGLVSGVGVPRLHADISVTVARFPVTRYGLKRVGAVAAHASVVTAAGNRQGPFHPSNKCVDDAKADRPACGWAYPGGASSGEKKHRVKNSQGVCCGCGGGGLEEDDKAGDVNGHGVCRASASGGKGSLGVIAPAAVAVCVRTGPLWYEVAEVTGVGSPDVQFAVDVVVCERPSRRRLATATKEAPPVEGGDDGGDDDVEEDRGDGDDGRDCRTERLTLSGSSRSATSASGIVHVVAHPPRVVADDTEGLTKEEKRAQEKAAKAAKKERKAAEKAAKKERKAAEKAAKKERKAAEKAAKKERKAAEKAAKKQEKEAATEAARKENEAEKETKKDKTEGDKDVKEAAEEADIGKDQPGYTDGERKEDEMRKKREDEQRKRLLDDESEPEESDAPDAPSTTDLPTASRAAVTLNITADASTPLSTRLARHYILRPAACATKSTACAARTAEAPARWLLLSREDVDTTGRTCGKVGASHAALASESTDRCGRSGAAAECLGPQLAAIYDDAVKAAVVSASDNGATDDDDNDDDDDDKVHDADDGASAGGGVVAALAGATLGNGAAYEGGDKPALLVRRPVAAPTPTPGVGDDNDEGISKDQSPRRDNDPALPPLELTLTFAAGVYVSEAPVGDASFRAAELLHLPATPPPPRAGGTAGAAAAAADAAAAAASPGVILLTVRRYDDVAEKEEEVEGAQATETPAATATATPHVTVTTAARATVDTHTRRLTVSYECAGGGVTPPADARAVDVAPRTSYLVRFNITRPDIGDGRSSPRDSLPSCVARLADAVTGAPLETVGVDTPPGPLQATLANVADGPVHPDDDGYGYLPSSAVAVVADDDDKGGRCGCRSFWSLICYVGHGCWLRAFYILLVLVVILIAIFLFLWLLRCCLLPLIAARSRRSRDGGSGGGSADESPFESIGSAASVRSRGGSDGGAPAVGSGTGGGGSKRGAKGGGGPAGEAPKTMRPSRSGGDGAMAGTFYESAFASFVRTSDAGGAPPPTAAAAAGRGDGRPPVGGGAGGPARGGGDFGRDGMRWRSPTKNGAGAAASAAIAARHRAAQAAKGAGTAAGGTVHAADLAVGSVLQTPSAAGETFADWMGGSSGGVKGKGSGKGPATADASSAAAEAERQRRGGWRSTSEAMPATRRQQAQAMNGGGRAAGLGGGGSGNGGRAAAPAKAAGAPGAAVATEEEEARRRFFGNPHPSRRSNTTLGGDLGDDNAPVTPGSRV